MNSIRLFKTKMCVAIVLLLAWQTHESSALPTGLVSYWPGESNANDNSGNGHHGTLMNGAAFGAGNVGQAFSFDGSDDYVQVSDSDAWAFGSGGFTIDLFANFDTVKTGDAGNLPNVFIGQDQGGGSNNKWIFFATTSALVFHINGPGSVFLSAPFAPTTNQWYNLALTRSGNDYTFYVDGTSIGTTTSSLAIPNAAATLTIAQAENLGFFNGKLDEIQIYDRALSQTEIQSLSNAAVPEPATLVLLGSGLAGLGWFGRKRIKKDPRA